MDPKKEHDKATTAEQFNQKAYPAPTPEQVEWLESRRAEHEARNHRSRADLGARMPWRKLH